jgi:hypothetical protein
MKHDSEILKRIKSYFMRRKSADEAYEFELEAERDPFLYEALEGFESMLSSDMQQSMDELDDRLDAKIKPAFNWASMKMAATVLLTIGIGISLYFIVFNTESKVGEVANESVETKSYEPRQNELVFDTLGEISPNAYAVAEEETYKAIEDESAENGTYAANEPDLELKTTPIQKESVESESDSYAWTDTQSKKESKFKANDEDDTIIAMEEVVVSKNATSHGFVNAEPASASQDKPLRLKESSASATVTESSVDYAAENISSTEKRTGEKLEETPPKPAVGKSAFDSYVNKNIKTSEGMPRGTVSLSFELDRNGIPKKIQVTKSLCAACDAEAIRLLENGPAWEADSKKATGNVDIQFP